MLSDTGNHAAQFGDALQGQTTRLKQEPARLEVICQIAGELLTETQRMCSASVTLSRQLDMSAREVRTLTRRLQEEQAAAKTL